MPRATLNTAAHVGYFLKLLEVLPSPYASLDTNRLTVAYFCVSGLDILGALERVDAPALIRWVYAQQLSPPPGGEGAAADDGWLGGFRGAAYIGAPHREAGPPASSVRNP